eukprot:jgi/Tetstr1/466901/TSEL_011355.t1
MEAEQLDAAAAAEAAEEEDTAAPWRRLDPVPAKELMDAEGWVFLDVRSARDYGRDAYKKAVSVPFFKMAGIGLGATAEPLLEEFLVAMREKYPCKDAKLIVVGGGDGQLGESALQVLLDEGYTCLIEMAGGYGAWTKLFRTSGQRRVYGKWGDPYIRRARHVDRLQLRYPERRHQSQHTSMVA